MRNFAQAGKIGRDGLRQIFFVEFVFERREGKRAAWSRSVIALRLPLHDDGVERLAGSRDSA